jgi:hypothetical protein
MSQPYTSFAVQVRRTDRHGTKLSPGVVAWLLLAALAGAPARPAGAAESPAEGATAPTVRAEDSFSGVLGRVRRAAAGREWQEAGWADHVIERWADRVADGVREATNSEAARVPVRFADVNNLGVAVPGNRLAGALVVAQNVDVDFAERSIILADGNANIGFANDCLVIARGAVRIAHGRGNLVAAGHFIHVSHDGDHRDATKGSLLVSGAVLDVSHASGSVCAAPELIRIGHANNCHSVNSPKREISHQKNCKEAKAEGLKLPAAGAAHPLAGQVRMKWIVQGRGVVLGFNGRRYVADLGKPIVDEAGAAVAGLEGWTVSFVDEGSHFVLFTDGRTDVPVMQPPGDERLDREFDLIVP